MTLFLVDGGVGVGGRLDWLEHVVEVGVLVGVFPLNALVTFSLDYSKEATKSALEFRMGSP